ncbi:MAG TPA: hypothetical protein VK696_07015 [Steroidobacteraceae bacterium]|jgi:hypothetical protein|nr:hypothetical protein [Steroidobacteraceae bacterium]
MRRRQLYDPLQRLAQSCWLVVRDQHRQAVEVREIPAGSDLRTTLNSARDERIGAGWNCTEIGRSLGFVFCERAGERFQIAIERFHPADPAPAHSDRADHTAKL